MRIALGIEYNGSNCHGWQRQPEVCSIQQTLETALSKIAAQEIVTVCAGRTDIGVHALNQVIHFDTNNERDANAWIRGTNTYLPPDIRVIWHKVMNENFHARFSAIARHYHYVLANSLVKPAIFDRHVSWCYRPLDCEKMQLASQYLIGEHDFASFRGADCQSQSTRRRVDSIIIERRGDIITFDIVANAFLHHMVRNIVGALMEIGAGRKPITWINDILALRLRCAAGVTASAFGLYFVRAIYPADFNLP